MRVVARRAHAERRGCDTLGLADLNDVQRHGGARIGYKQRARREGDVPRPARPLPDHQLEVLHIDLQHRRL